jgi:hypothetical protein
VSARRSGVCICDKPEIATVADVRRFAKSVGTCWWCGHHGIDLMRFGWEHLHVRCAWKKLRRGDDQRLGVEEGYRLFAVLEMRQRRVRLCCLGGTIFRRLLQHTTDDGGRECAATLWT